jgi:molecular chaperone GrpE
MTDKRTKRRSEEPGRHDPVETAIGPDASGVPQASAQEGADEAAWSAPDAATAAMPREDELSRVAAERDDYLGHLQRLQAEFDNYRKRVRRDQEELRLRAAETVVESLLPVLDNLRRALDAAVEHEQGGVAAGLELVFGQLRGTLAGHGLEEIPVDPGLPFDPEVHEAVLTQTSDEYDEGAVLQVLERGYLLHGRLLRPAKVIVVR